MVFFMTYAFMGLADVAVELDNPFGLYFVVVIVGIVSLVSDSVSLFQFDRLRCERLQEQYSC